MVILLVATISIVLGTIKTKADYIEALRVMTAELILEAVILIPCYCAFNH